MSIEVAEAAIMVPPPPLQDSESNPQAEPEHAVVTAVATGVRHGCHDAETAAGDFDFALAHHGTKVHPSPQVDMENRIARHWDEYGAHHMVGRLKLRSGRGSYWNLRGPSVLCPCKHCYLVSTVLSRAPGVSVGLPSFLLVGYARNCSSMRLTFLAPRRPLRAAGRRPRNCSSMRLTFLDR